MPKFDYIIQNPPYKGTLHISFLKCAISNINSTGKIIIIEPSTWLIDFKFKKLYFDLKQQLNGHVKSVVIENCNKEFNIGLYTPLSITTIDFSKEYNKIDFTCFGKNENTDSIFDCNLIGKYNLVKSILDKCESYDDKFINHIYNTKKSVTDENTYYAKYLQIIGRAFCGDPRWSDIWFRNGLYCAPIYFPMIDDRVGISHTPHLTLKTGRTYENPEFTDKVAYNIFGSKTELENFKYNIYNTKLFPFINIVLNIDQNNRTKNYVPFLCDKKYTDIEIYKLFNITKDEIELIENTIKKYNKNSEWFVRYMYGKNWKNYIKTLNK